MKPEQAVQLRSLDVPKLLVGHSALKRQCLRAVLVPHGVNVEETLPVAEPVAADGDRPRSPDVGGIVSHPVDSAEADDHLPAESTTSCKRQRCETQPPVVHAHASCAPAPWAVALPWTREPIDVLASLLNRFLRVDAAKMHVLHIQERGPPACVRPMGGGGPCRSQIAVPVVRQTSDRTIFYRSLGRRGSLLSHLLLCNMQAEARHEANINHPPTTQAEGAG